MRVVRSPLPFLALAALLAGCNGDATNVATANAPANNGAQTFGMNKPANDANATNDPAKDEHAGHDHGPGEHGTEPAANTPPANTPPANTPPADSGPKVGVETTKPGTGAGAKDGDLLAMRYTGRLTNGKQFDSNVGAGKKPFNVQLGPNAGVIQGWIEGLQGIKEGEKRTLKIPAVKGYGAQGGGDAIPPNADLVFDIECLDILPAGREDVVEREALKTGTGAAIKSGQSVTFHFVGKLVDGQEFDSTYKAKKPLTVKLGKGELDPVGLEDAMVGMRVGGKYRLTFPPAVAFGPSGNRTGTVPPNSVVVFEIEPLSAK